MRVLAMVHAYPPYHNAGAEMTIHPMMRRLVERGHDVTVLLSRDHDEVGSDYDFEGVHVQRHRDVADPIPYFVQGGLKRVDVAVTHLENTQRAAALCDINAIPLVQVIHNTQPFTEGALLRGPCQLAVFNTDWMAEHYARYWASVSGGPQPPHIVVHPPVFASEYATTPGASKVALINLNEAKGGELFWSLARAMPTKKFLGVRGAYGEQIVPDDAPANVTVLSHQPPARMRNVYQNTRVLLMPSSYESYGRTAVEAACSGIPTIATPTPGLREALGDAGTFVELEDFAGWKAAITRLLTPKGWAKASRAAKELADSLTPDRDLDRFANALEGVVRRGFAAIAR